MVNLTSLNFTLIRPQICSPQSRPGGCAHVVRERASSGRAKPKRFCCDWEGSTDRGSNPSDERDVAGAMVLRYSGQRADAGAAIARDWILAGSVATPSGAANGREALRMPTTCDVAFGYTWPAP